MKINRNKFLYNPLFIAGVLIIIIFFITGSNLMLKSKTFGTCTIEYTHYNNYLIFKQSFFHLIENNDLYKLYPNEHWDLYKYSPTFALLMAPIAVLPNAVGLLIWNLLNVLILFFAIWKLPVNSDKSRLYILGFILIELITSIQNSQSNALMAGLIIFAFIFLENKQTALASLLIVLTIFIKLFGVVALALFIFYPDKIKFILYTIGWTLLFAALPLILISSSQLLFLYHSWFNLLQNDHSISLGISVAGIFSSWFGIECKSETILIGAVLFCLPFFKYQFFNEMKFKLFFLSSILLWIIIFNHKAESPSFVIAVSGVAIWFFSQKIKIENIILIVFAFILTVLSPTDIFPKYIRVNYVVPYALKALPCILIWIKIIFDMMFYKTENTLEKII